MEATHFTREAVQQALEELLDGVSLTCFEPDQPGLAVGAYNYQGVAVSVFFVDTAQISVVDLPIEMLAPVVAGDVLGLMVLSDGKCVSTVSAPELLQTFRVLYSDTAIVESLEEYLAATTPGNPRL